MNKIINEVLLLTVLISNVNCLPNRRNPLKSEIQSTETHTLDLEFSKIRNDKVCKLEFRLVPKLTGSFSTNFMMFKKPKIVCFWAKTQFEENSPETTTKNARTTTAQPLTTR